MVTRILPSRALQLLLLDLNPLMLTLLILGLCFSCKPSDCSCSPWPESGSRKEHALQTLSPGPSLCSSYDVPHDVHWLKARMVLIVICQNPTMEGMVRIKSCHSSHTRVPANGSRGRGRGVVSARAGVLLQASLGPFPLPFSCLHPAWSSL